MNASNAQSKTVETYLRGIAGLFLMLSVVLYHVHSPNWIWFTLFIGANLFQSAFTNWCPMIMILKKIFGIKKVAA